MRYVILFFSKYTKKNSKKKSFARPNMTEKKFDQINNAQWSYERKKLKPFIIKYIIWKII